VPGGIDAVRYVLGAVARQFSVILQLKAVLPPGLA
jgi:hypothetical protein